MGAIDITNTRCNVAILAGGQGTRLKERTGSLPKPMALIRGRPVLEHQMELCKRDGFTRIALLVHYEHETIRAHFGDGTAFGVALHYCIEREARGTAGALLDALPALDDRFVVLYGDTYADVDLRAIWSTHENAAASATLLLHPNDHPHDSDLVEVDAGGRVIAVHPYPHPHDVPHRNLVNAALYVMERRPLAGVIPADRKTDIAKHTFPAMLSSGLRLQAHITPEYIKDMGTPDRLDKVERDILAGLPERLSTRFPRTAVFLDRDGTINVEVNHLSRPEQLELLPGVPQAVRALNRAGVLAICITNQPVVARGEVTMSGLQRIHAKLDHLLGESNAYLDGLYVCPHHPDRGFPGEVSELKIQCECRKPRTGLFDQAIRDLGIDRRESWMVGDTTSDIAAGRRAGLRTVLLRTGIAGADRKHPCDPDFIAPDLGAAVEWILHGHASVARQLFEVCGEAVTARLVLIGGPERSGKTSTARVLREIMATAGRVAHVICLDAWLRPAATDGQQAGVLSRYDMEAAGKSLLPLLLARDRWSACIPQLQWDSLRSIGPDDLVIVEGVTALMDDALLARASVRIYVDTPAEIQRQRLAMEGDQRDKERTSEAATLRSQIQNDLIAVRASASQATHYIRGSSAT